MTKSWRPPEWEKQKLLDSRIGKLNGYDRTLVEAGADAMLEALYELAKKSPTRKFTIYPETVIINNYEDSQ